MSYNSRNNNYFSSNMSEIDWGKIRAQANIRGVGAGQCEVWCREAIKVPQVQDRYAIRVACQGALNNGIEVVHWFLWNPREVADGTACQYDSCYPLGYFGDPAKASAFLYAIYSLGTDPLLR